MQCMQISSFIQQMPLTAEEKKAKDRERKRQKLKDETPEEKEARLAKRRAAYAMAEDKKIKKCEMSEPQNPKTSKAVRMARHRRE